MRRQQTFLRLHANRRLDPNRLFPRTALKEDSLGGRAEKPDMATRRQSKCLARLSRLTMREMPPRYLGPRERSFHTQFFQGHVSRRPAGRGWEFA